MRAARAHLPNQAAVLAWDTILLAADLDEATAYSAVRAMLPHLPADSVLSLVRRAFATPILMRH